jgi:hypothetical protein
LCKTDCAGLKQKNKASKAGEDEASQPTAWAELDKLKLK